MNSPFFDNLILKRSSTGLFSLNRLKQCFEVTLTERTGAFALDNFVEDRRTILDRLGKDLEQIPERYPIGTPALYGLYKPPHAQMQPPCALQKEYMVLPDQGFRF